MERGSYFHKVGSLPSKSITTAQLIDAAAEKWPEREAIILQYENSSLTFSEMKIQAEALGAGLLKLGLKPGDRLVLLGVNTLHWCVTMLAAAKAGLISVLLNPAYRAQELGVALKKVRAKAIVADHKFKTQDYPGMLAELAPGMSSAPHGQPLSSSQLPDLSLVIVATEEKLPGCYRLADVLHSTTDRTELLYVEKSVDLDDPVFILFSSGSTGEPKAAVQTHFGVLNSTYFMGRRLQFHKKHRRNCLLAPLYHTFGNTCGIIMGLLHGSTTIVPGPIYNTDNAITALQTEKCDIVMGTPTMFIDICNKLQKPCPHVEVIFVAGSVLPTDLTYKMAETFNNSVFVNGYGMTESCCAFFTSMLNDPVEKKTKTTGFILDNVEIKIIDENGKTVPFGTPGECCFRSPYTFLEYWENDDMARQTKTKSGWLKTGDLMILSEDGYGTVIGRLKDIINRGGENIYPKEIEDFLCLHPDIVNAQVYGVADKRLGEDVAASIILQKQSNLTESSLKEYCKGKIAHFKIPKHVRFVDEYPMTGLGKIKKYMLKSIHENILSNT